MMRHGIALPIVLIGILVLGILVAGAFFGSMQEMRVGRNALEYERAFVAAEHGLMMALDGWGSESAARPIGSQTRQAYSPHGGITIATVITRVSPLSYWLTSEAASTESGVEAERWVGSLVRLEVPEVLLPAALSVRVPESVPNAELGGGVRIDGNETTPPGWADCPGSGITAAGLATDDASRWTGTSHTCDGDGCITGDPPLSSMPRLADTVRTADEFDEVWRMLDASATVRLPPASVIGGFDRPLGPHEVEGACDRRVLTNWGDPTRSTACAQYFPVIRSAGDLHMAGGAGQGVLMVDGDLTLSGGATFVGLVLVRGGLRTVMPGGRVIGAVRTAGEDGGSTSLAGGGRFDYSRCAVMFSLAPHARPRLEPGSWIELYH